jgi:hypothetical protein
MNRMIIPFATAAAVFSLWFYPDESHYAAATHSAQASPGASVIVGASDSVHVARPVLRKAFPAAPAPVIRLASAAPEETSFDPEEAARRWDVIEKGMACAKPAARCGLPDTDSRARHFAIRDGLLEQARWFQEQRPRNAAEEKQSYQAASRLLSFPDEAVQGAALEWILSLPPQAKTMRSLKNNLDLMVDPELARLAVLEAKRHLGGEGEDEALAFVGRLVLEGGVFASREAARLAPTLLTPSTEERLRGWLAELPPQSAKARLLREGLEANRGGI